ncbi:MAG: fimbria/pilus outer membrane usher protein, partial [Candidatus Delongbacteria bacterium]|nr:fimbria/pilus outer membrane usher protein [Candidatus Delongbacteria bacterium]
NDILVETIKVEPGPFNLKQTSFQHGINDVKVKIENDIGETQEIDIDAFSNALQLQKGLNQYSFNLGLCSNYNENMYEYDEKSPLLSFYYRRGLNNRLTLGAYSQVKLDQMLFGIGSNFSTGIGNFDIDIATSKTDSVEIDYAGKLSYNYFNNNLKQNPYQRQWKATFEYKGTEFSNLNVLKPHNELSYILTGFMNQRLTSTMSTSLSASYSLGNDNVGNAYSYSLSLSKSFKSNLRISCSFSNQRRIGEKDNLRASLNFMFKPMIRNMINSSYNSMDHNSKLSWYYHSKNNKVRNDLTTNYSENNPLNFSNRFSYSGYRGDVSMIYNLDESSDGVFNNNVNISGNTSIVFVNGKFGWSKTIRNSFALVKTNDVLKGHKVGIQRRDKGVYQYSSDMFGSAVYTNLTPYRVQQFDIELPDIPVGYEANAGEQILLPTYKSGFLIDVEAKSFIFARGRLVDKDNKPLENITARVVPYGRFHEEEKSIFTNKGGYFYVSGLKPGSYTIEFDSEDYKPVKIKILKKNKQGYCKLGSLKVDETKRFKYNYLKK